MSPADSMDRHKLDLFYPAAWTWAIAASGDKDTRSAPVFTRAGRSQVNAGNGPDLPVEGCTSSVGSQVMQVLAGNWTPGPQQQLPLQKVLTPLLEAADPLPAPCLDKSISDTPQRGAELPRTCPSLNLPQG
ncbi:hypothetical protein AAES_72577 [Amazona aestiva]|uniref:Uncharacterized protein n=1 Tax=Amazona aestiva TaxID=12930 RepID=A0A0Q3MI91_AMAAE|nr:hypothetical protein AAES_72577 [Amazona aestiva]